MMIDFKKREMHLSSSLHTHTRNFNSFLYFLPFTFCLLSFTKINPNNNNSNYFLPIFKIYSNHNIKSSIFFNKFSNFLITHLFKSIFIHRSRLFNGENRFLIWEKWFLQFFLEVSLILIIYDFFLMNFISYLGINLCNLYDLFGFVYCKLCYLGFNFQF